MHGLNTMQSVNQSPVMYNSAVGTGDRQAAWTSNINCDTPGILSTFLASNFLTDDVEFFIKRCYLDVTLYNDGPIPVILEVTWLRVRKDIPSSVAFADIISNQAPNIQQPYQSSFTGEDFRVYFQILKSKRYSFRPGTSKQFVCKSAYNNSKKLTNEYNVANGYYSYLRNNRMLFIKVYGVPVGYTSVPPPAAPSSVILGPVSVYQVAHRYLSFYRMDDVIPTSTALPADIGNVALSTNNQAKMREVNTTQLQTAAYSQTRTTTV